MCFLSVLQVILKVLLTRVHFCSFVYLSNKCRFYLSFIQLFNLHQNTTFEQRKLIAYSSLIILIFFRHLVFLIL